MFCFLQSVLKLKLLGPILQSIFPILTAAPPAGEQDPEDEEDDCGDPTDKLMPLLLGYLSTLSEAKIGHVTKVFYALENFMENLGKKGSDIEPYLSTLMETMLSALNNMENLKIKELAVSAIGAIGDNTGCKVLLLSCIFSANAAKELLVPYFPPLIESLNGFLTATTEEMRPLQNQSLGKLTRLSLISPSTRYRRQQTLFLCPDTLAVLARTMGKDVFGPLAAECIQLGLKLTDAIDDPDLRRCTYGLYSAVSTVSPESLTPHLTAITTVMQLALNSVSHVNRFSVENAYIDEKEDACDAMGEIALSTG
ncbi:hypothetical protein XENOCAPTIV_029131 [Xenoophorus captivus]|uniref:Cullin-associated and neddylation-dissociated protein 1 n=1 Tax=Xenoophorus captivus TaxID=1517983 RepID=A0ABV0QF29_9TELE